MFIPDPGNRVKRAPDSQIRKADLTKNSSIFNLKYCYLTRGNIIWDVYPGSRGVLYPKFFSIPDPHPGSRGQKSAGSRIRICNTAGNKVQKDEQRWHLLACKYNQFCGVPLLWIMLNNIPDRIIPTASAGPCLGMVERKNKEGLPTLVEDFSAGCAEKFGRKRRASKCIVKHMNQDIKKNFT